MSTRQSRSLQLGRPASASRLWHLQLHGTIQLRGDLLDRERVVVDVVEQGVQGGAMVHLIGSTSRLEGCASGRVPQHRTLAEVTGLLGAMRVTMGERYAVLDGSATSTGDGPVPVLVVVHDYGQVMGALRAPELGGAGLQDLAALVLMGRSAGINVLLSGVESGPRTSMLAGVPVWDVPVQRPARGRAELRGLPVVS